MRPAVRGVGRALSLFGGSAAVYLTTFAAVRAVSRCDSWLCQVSATAFLAVALYFFALGFFVGTIIIGDRLPPGCRRAFWLTSLLWMALTVGVLGSTFYRLYELQVSDERSPAPVTDRFGLPMPR